MHGKGRDMGYQGQMLLEVINGLVDFMGQQAAMASEYPDEEDAVTVTAPADEIGEAGAEAQKLADKIFEEEKKDKKKKKEK